MLRTTVATVGAVMLLLTPTPALGAKRPAPNTLVITVKGLPPGAKATLRIKGPDGFGKRVSTATRKKLKRLDPGRYRIRTGSVAGYTPTKTKAKRTVTNRKGANVTFRFRPPQPPPATPAAATVSGLRLTEVTALSLKLQWTNPPGAERILVRRALGQTPPATVTDGTNVPLAEDLVDQVADTGRSPTTDYSYSVFVRYRDGSTSPPASTTARTLRLGDIDAGNGHTCAIDYRGKPWCWGQGPAQGYGGTALNRQPVAVDTSGVLAGVTPVDITAGNAHTCTLADDGRAFCWGVNNDGQLGNGATSAQETTPVAVAGNTRFTALSAGNYYTCGIDGQGRVWCWGDNFGSQIGNGTSVDQPAPQLIGGVLTGKRIVDVSAGTLTTCAVDDQGLYYCWGSNLDGKFGDGTLTSSSTPKAITATGALEGKRLRDIETEAGTTCAIDIASVGYCWGNGGAGRLGNGGTSDSPIPVGITSTTALPAGQVAAIDVGFQQVCARSTSGTAACWGFNGNGQLGDGSLTYRLVPTAVATNGALAGESLVRVAAGDFHTCALAASARAFCWGAGTALGDGVGAQSPTPVRVLGFGP